MPPKTDGPPRPKKVMTPEMLDKLAAARAKANEARMALKSDNDELKLALLQRKMDAIKKTQTKAPESKPELPEPEPEKLPEEPEPPELNSMKCELAPEQPEQPEQINFPEPEPVKAPQMKANKIKKKKPVVIVENSSDSESSDDNSNVIYIRRKSKGKKPQIDATPQPQKPQEVAQPPRQPINPFFSYYHGSHRNFQ